MSEDILEGKNYLESCTKKNMFSEDGKRTKGLLSTPLGGLLLTDHKSFWFCVLDWPLIFSK